MHDNAKNTVLYMLLIVEKYFRGVTCFLLFNVFAMCGSLLAAVVHLVILCFFLLRIVTLTGLHYSLCF